MHKTRRLAVLLGAAALTSTAFAAMAVTASAARAAAAVPVSDTSPPWLGKAQDLGAVAPTASVSARVYLAPNGGMRRLRDAATAVATPGSSAAHKTLTPAQFQAQFAPSSSTVAAVASWLQSKGLSTSTGPHNRYLTASGTARQAAAAFGRSIDKYDVAGHTVQAPSGALTVPSALASSVLTIVGLDTTPYRATPLHVTQGSALATAASVPADAGTIADKACSSYFGQKVAAGAPAFRGQQLPLPVCGYTNKQLHNAYLRSQYYAGKGVTVAIIGGCASTTIEDDIGKLASVAQGLPYRTGQYTETVPDGAACAGGVLNNEGIEQTLDVEAVHAMAPDADIHFYASTSTYLRDMADSVAAALDDDRTDIISMSFAAPEVYTESMEYVLAQAALQGVSFVAASGDQGDNFDTGTNTYTWWQILDPMYPASSVFATAVGGTSLAIDASGARAFESGWGNRAYVSSTSGGWQDLGFVEGSGGGSSIFYSKPGYQSADWYERADTITSTMRSTPDVAMDADPATGMYAGWTSSGQWITGAIGGTSLAAPLFAGMTAVSLDYAQERAHTRLHPGLLNGYVYAFPSSFTDVRAGTPVAGVASPDVDGQYVAFSFAEPSLTQKLTPGWDNVTGIGVPNTYWVVALWQWFSPQTTVGGVTS